MRLGRGPWRIGGKGGLVLAVAVSGLALPASAGAALGDLTQKPGPAGCISEGGTLGACVDGTELVFAQSVTVSPDGVSAYAASGLSDAVVVFDRAADGTLTQKAGTAGCISDSGSFGACVDGTALDGTRSVTVSPDGKSVYAASSNSKAVAVFDRAEDGALTQKAGTAGCISEDGTLGACVDGTALDGVFSVTVSPDGTSLYAASDFSSAVVVFDRAGDGALTQKAGTAGCISDSGSGGLCVDGTALSGVESVTVSRDGKSVYGATRFGSDAVAVFDRAADGTLTQKAGTAGCISETGSGGLCVDGTALDEPASVAVSPDGTSVYVASFGSDAVVVFDRAADGTLAPKAGTAGCISDTGSGGLCVDGTALDASASVTASPDGKSLYAASANSNAVVVFDRAADGTLTQKAGTAGCISETGSGGACVDGTAVSGARSVAVSPDGSSVYAASSSSDAVAVFERERVAADMSMSLQGRPSPLSVGGQLTYKLRMRNDGPGTATGVTAVLTLAPSETFVSATSACLHAAGVVTCTIPRAIEPGAGATPSVTVSEGLPGLISATATVSSHFDPNSANDSAAERTRVTP